jgi:iron(III) transport system permease protein
VTGAPSPFHPAVPAVSVRAAGNAIRGLVVAGVIGVLTAPVLVVGWSLLRPDREIWSLLARTTLVEMVLTTVGLVLGVAIGAVLLGSALAWLVVATRFPGHALLRRLLVLPMAVPSYVVAFVYVGLLQYAGPVQGRWRSWFGTDAWFPAVRTPLGAGLVFVLTLYPYVYIPCLVAFAERSAGPAAAARTLGLGAVATWWRVVLPAARPAVAAGGTLVVMEVATDVGVARAFSVRTVGEGVLRVWFGLDRRGAAGELAMALVGIVVAVVVLERLTRGRRDWAQRGRSAASVPPVRLRGWRAAAASGACVAVVALGAGIPLATLGSWAVTARRRGGEGAFDARFAALTRTTVLLASLTALSCLLLALLVGGRSRARAGGGRAGRRATRLATRLATLGYAVPGLVVGSGALSVLAFADGRLDDLANWDDRFYVPFLLVGSVGGVVYALTVRFLAVARENIDAGAERIDPAIPAAAATLGAGWVRRLLHIELPLLWSTLVAAALLVAVDAAKELPVTLLLRPAGRDTLSVFVWNMTNESRWEEAAAPALAIVALSVPLVAVVFARVGRPVGGNRRG